MLAQDAVLGRQQKKSRSPVGAARICTNPETRNEQRPSASELITKNHRAFSPAPMILPTFILFLRHALLRTLPHPPIHPLIHSLIPELRILRLHHPMPLIGKIKHLRRHAQQLQRVE